MSIVIDATNIESVIRWALVLNFLVGAAMGGYIGWQAGWKARSRRQYEIEVDERQ